MNDAVSETYSSLVSIAQNTLGDNLQSVDIMVKTKGAVAWRLRVGLTKPIFGCKGGFSRHS